MKTDIKQQRLMIGRIPAILWGEPSDRIFVAVHGNMSSKSDEVICILSEAAARGGFRVLSFDLPGHGDRKDDPTLCKPDICADELRAVIAHARTLASEIYLFACSIGAYFSLLALADESPPPRRALFLSPVVDMERVIKNMMGWFGVSAERLQAEREIATPIGQTLYWDYYTYVGNHPILHWDVPTEILYGSDDTTCEADAVCGFSEKFRCGLTVMERGEHFFHTSEQLEFYRKWLTEQITRCYNGVN